VQNILIGFIYITYNETVLFQLSAMRQLSFSLLRCARHLKQSMKIYEQCSCESC